MKISLVRAQEVKTQLEIAYRDIETLRKKNDDLITDNQELSTMLNKMVEEAQ